jgi:hypothetical protein
MVTLRTNRGHVRLQPQEFTRVFADVPHRFRISLAYPLSWV